MKERPILFSAPMVKAILEVRKTQTRRIIKTQPPDIQGQQVWRNIYKTWSSWIDGSLWYDFNCPHGNPGDRLWVKETWLTDREYDHLKPSEIFKGAPIEYCATDIPFHLGRKRQSIFMPRWASRITLEITNVRVERVQEISGKDAIHEGITGEITGFAIDDFKSLWDSINGKKYPWQSNPWVWVIEFRTIK